MSDIECAYCGSEFVPATYNQSYCGPTCREARATDVRRERRETYVCSGCGGTFERAVANRHTRTGMCRACSQVGEAHPRWSTGEHFHKAGNRWWVTLPQGGKRLRARFVMEQHLGRELTFNEVVHHRNEDPTDDRLENLELMTRSEHTRMHVIQRAERRRAAA